MSFSLLSTCRPTAPNLEDKDKAVSLTTLDFFTVLVKGDLKFYTYGQVGLRTTTVRNAGRGGHSTIEIGTLTRNKSLVAVKRYHLSAKFQSSVEHHRSVTKILGQLTRELRILSHEGLRKHPHIIDIVGVCAEQANGSLDWAIVLEYASHGTLATFLKGIGASTSGVQRADMILGVARGLQALHQLGICHGDIKAENSLVFPKGTGGWVVKISDFGQAIFPAYHHPRGRVECPAGTRLLEAPEIRKGEASMNPEFDIQSALRTDVFSFGLLAWEVMKRGQRFFDTTWIDDGESANVDSQERFLNMLPEDGLLAYGLDFVQALELDKKTECAIMDVMRGTLKDESQLRKPMHQLVELFHRESPPL
ncbi:hypothetical protein QQZ08_000329 [Neonectria magnoliae]|uniref:Protein kinase domain-containing protein n=1 Tax=Neonectria magnoliae TaxID=2732573 RepID=A0ABR1III8_9HYPO